MSQSKQLQHLPHTKANSIDSLYSDDKGNLGLIRDVKVFGHLCFALQQNLISLLLPILLHILLGMLENVFRLSLRSIVVAFCAAIWACLISSYFLRFSSVTGRVVNILDSCSAMFTLSYCQEILYIGNQTESQ